MTDKEVAREGCPKCKGNGWIQMLPPKVAPGTRHREQIQEQMNVAARMACPECIRVAALITKVRAEEREACAKVVDGFVDTQEFTAARKAENDAPASAVMHMIQSRYYAALASAIRERTR